MPQQPALHPQFQSATILGAVNVETMKNLANYLTTILFLCTLRGSSRFECQCRQWLLACWVLDYATDYISLAGTYFPPHVYSIFIGVRATLDALIDAVGQLTYYATMENLAQGEGNNAHVIMKSAALSYLVNLAAMGVRFPLLRFIDNHSIEVIWVLLVGVQLVSIAFFYASVRYLQVDTVNGRRLRLCIQHFVRTGSENVVLSVEECNWRDPLLAFGWFGQPSRHYGCSLRALPVTSKKAVHRVGSSYIVAYDHRRRTGWVCASRTATDEQLFIAAV